MIEKMAWNMFKNTGNINMFLEMRQIENLKVKDNKKVEVNEYCKNEGNSKCRK